MVILEGMKFIALSILSLVTLALAEWRPSSEYLDDFVQKMGRIPNRCVQKGDMYKCAGYKDVSGALVNKKTGKIYLYSQHRGTESYQEYSCDAFFVEDNGNDEVIRCEQGTVLYEVTCNTTYRFIDVMEYDELGILMDKSSYNDGDPGFCRKSFHHQYGNGSGKRYIGKLGTKQVERPSESRLGYGGGIGDGLAGLLGGGGGGVSTKAKGSIKTPSERDIVISGGSRSMSEIHRVVKQRTPGLRHTFNKFLKKKPGFQGTVTLKLTIAPNGEILKTAIVSSTTKFAEFDNEIKGAVSRWVFRRNTSPANTVVTIPFYFSE